MPRPGPAGTGRSIGSTINWQGYRNRMQVISKLVKTEIVIGSMKRQKDQVFVFSDPNKSMPTKVVMNPEDVFAMVKASLNPSVLSFGLLLPFALLCAELRKAKNPYQAITPIVQVLTLLFSAVLIYGGRDYLAQNPIDGSLLVIGFAVLFAVMAGKLISASFVYASSLLLLIGYLLLLGYSGFLEPVYPVLAVPFVAVLYASARLLERTSRQSLARHLYGVAFAIAGYFSVVLLVSLPDHLQNSPGIPALSFAAYSALFLVRFVRTRAVLLLYPGVALACLAYYAVLHVPVGVPRAYFGLGLIALSMGLLTIGNWYYNLDGFFKAHPIYVAGMILPFTAIPYAIRDEQALMLSASLFSINFFGISRSTSAKPNAGEFWQRWLIRVAFASASLSAAAFFLLLWDGHLLASPGTIIGALGLAIFYRRIAFGVKQTFLEERNQYVYQWILFFTIFYMGVLVALNPLGSLSRGVLLALPAAFVVSYYAYYLEKKGRTSLAESHYEASCLIVIAALFIPFWRGQNQPELSSFLALFAVVLYSAFARYSRSDSPLYLWAIVFPVLLYNFVNATAALAGNSAVYFVVGMIFAGTAIFLHSRGARLAKSFYLAWFNMAAVSTYLSAQLPGHLQYALAIWAVTFLLAPRALRLLQQRQIVVELETQPSQGR